MKPFLLLFFVISAILAGCQNNNSNPSSTTNATVDSGLAGSITGKIIPYDEYGKNLNNISGVNISIKGTSYTTQSNTQGWWTLTNVIPGVYDIIFSRPGFDSVMLFGFPFPGNGTALLNCQDFRFATDFYSYSITDDAWTIGQLPSAIFSNITFGTAYISDSTKSYLPVTMNSDKNSPVSVFFSDKPDVSKYSYKNFYEASQMAIDTVDLNGNHVTVYYGSTYDSVNKILKTMIPKEYLTRNFKSGDVLFARVYPGYIGWTKDLRNGFKQWLGLGSPSQQVVSIKVP